MPDENTDKAAVSAAIRRGRLDLGLSQKRLGEMVGRDQAAVSNWERGAPPPLPMLRTVAEALGIEREVGLLPRVREKSA